MREEREKKKGKKKEKERGKREEKRKKRQEEQRDKEKRKVNTPSIKAYNNQSDDGMRECCSKDNL